MTQKPPKDPPEKRSLRLLRQARQVELAELARLEGKQDLGFCVREFVLCGLPYRRPDSLSYERRNGSFVLRVEGSSRVGLPYGQDRLLPIWLATAFQAAGCPHDNTICFRSASDLVRAFQTEEARFRPPSGTELTRLRQRIERVFWATYGIDNNWRPGKPLRLRRYQLIREVNLWFHQDTPLNQHTLWQNTIELDPTFADDLRQASLPIDLHTVRGLKENPAALDLYVWQAWRSYRLAKLGTPSEVRIPVFGRDGLLQQLGSTVNDEYKARQLIRRWQASVQEAWRNCPNRLTADAETLVLRPAVALKPGAKLFLPGVSEPPPLPAPTQERPHLALTREPADNPEN